MTAATLLMPLLNEGTDVWRPVTAELLEDRTYRILGPMPDDEEWTFAPGSIVAAQLRNFDDGKKELVAMPRNAFQDGSSLAQKS
jgi:hypothetical protein